MGSRVRVIRDYINGSTMLTSDWGIVQSTNKVGTVTVRDNHGSSWSFRRTDLITCEQTPADIKSIIKKLENDIKEEKLKLKFINTSGFDVFDEDQFRVWKALDVIEGTKDRKVKVEELTKLLK